LLRDGDTIYGTQYRRSVHSLGIEEVLLAPRRPWQILYIDRLIASLRRERLDHVIIFDDRNLIRMLRSYFACYLGPRTQLALPKRCPEPGQVQPTEQGNVIVISHVRGLHHEYRRAA
jgi:hypothetical protein